MDSPQAARSCYYLVSSLVAREGASALAMVATGGDGGPGAYTSDEVTGPPKSSLPIPLLSSQSLPTLPPHHPSSQPLPFPRSLSANPSPPRPPQRTVDPVSGIADAARRPCERHSRRSVVVDPVSGIADAARSAKGGGEASKQPPQQQGGQGGDQALVGGPAAADSPFASTAAPGIIFPTMITVCLAFAVFFATPTQLDIRVSTTVTLFLALIAVQFVIEEQLPKTSYVTAFGQLVLVSYATIVLVILECLLVFYLTSMEEVRFLQGKLPHAHDNADGDDDDDNEAGTRGGGSLSRRSCRHNKHRAYGNDDGDDCDDCDDYDDDANAYQKYGSNSGSSQRLSDFSYGFSHPHHRSGPRASSSSRSLRAARTSSSACSSSRFAPRHSNRMSTGGAGAAAAAAAAAGAAGASMGVSLCCGGGCCNTPSTQSRASSSLGLLDPAASGMDDRCECCLSDAPTPAAAAGAVLSAPTPASSAALAAAISSHTPSAPPADYFHTEPRATTAGNTGGTGRTGRNGCSNNCGSNCSSGNESDGDSEDGIDGEDPMAQVVDEGARARAASKAAALWTVGSACGSMRREGAEDDGETGVDGRVGGGGGASAGVTTARDFYTGVAVAGAGSAAGALAGAGAPGEPATPTAFTTLTSSP
ncbi:unnamed protein product [Closterium sp. Naga37s-1]|nr:unnamed protein product [Closterium sp. Naga37s-1]